MSNFRITILRGGCSLAAALVLLLTAGLRAAEPGYTPNTAASAATPPQVLSDYNRSSATPIQGYGTQPPGPSPAPALQPAALVDAAHDAPRAAPQEALRPRSAAREPLPLPARGTAPQGAATPAAPLLTTGLSLAAVLALFLAVAWVMRRGMPGAATLLPSEVVESLGRAPLAGRQQMHLIRCGNKLLLVSISSAGAETLTEITDPQEVDRLSGLCRQAHPQSATKAFRQVLEQLGSRTTAPGFAGDSRLEAMELAKRRPEHRYGGLEDDDA